MCLTPTRPQSDHPSIKTLPPTYPPPPATDPTHNPANHPNHHPKQALHRPATRPLVPDPSPLSAGEKQILAIALLWGLARPLADSSPWRSTPPSVTQLRLHLHRGIGYLAGDPHLKRLQDLCHLARPNPTPESGAPASDSPQG
ncbi:MAG: hypothetical protein ACKO24_08865 [Leptolyngbyaceae cyanobacterium]